MKKINFIFSISVVLVLGLLIGCKSTKQASKTFSEKLETADYILVKIADKDVEDMNLEMHVDTEEQSISGDAGCNSYRFEYKLEEGNLDLGYGVATKMYCEDTMEIERLFFTQSGKVTKFTQTEKELHFKNDEGKILIKAKKQ
ncbi:MAG: META domain-containing protein [Bacteroidota bacterium]